MQKAFAIACSVVLLSCGGAPTPPPGSTQPRAFISAPVASPTAAPAPVPTAAPAPVPNDRDPEVMKLAAAAMTCPYDKEQGDFDDDCPAFKVWWEGGLSDFEHVRRTTLLSMLEDPDEKVRVLGARPGMQETGDYFDEPIRARRLVAVAAKETNGWVVHEVSHLVARIDAEKLGLTAELRELAKNPRLRVGLASSVRYHTTPFVLELTRTILQDQSEHVSKAIALSLDRGADDPALPETFCKLLFEQLSRTDDGVRDFFHAAVASRCAGGPETVITELTKRVADPSTVKRSVGTGYALGAYLTCDRTKSDDLKKKGYRILLALTDAKVTDPFLRLDAIDFLAACDKTAATKALGALARDKDKEVAARAKSTLEELKNAK